jgi:hypothetical protein
MNTQQWLAVIGAGAGSLGSIITAFSLNAVIRELNIARGFLEVTVEALASNQANIPVFQGLADRYHRASRWGNKVVWVGVAARGRVRPSSSEHLPVGVAVPWSRQPSRERRDRLGGFHGRLDLLWFRLGG